MKKIIFPLIALLLLFASCGEEDAGGASMANNQQTMAKYSDDNLSFDIPESWQKNFKAVTRDVGAAGDTYPQTDFYYTDGSRDILLMSIGKYTRDQWENLKKTGEDLKDAMLGESGDKNHVYSIRYENHDYIEERDLRDMLNSLKAEAQKLRDKIKIS